MTETDTDWARGKIVDAEPAEPVEPRKKRERKRREPKERVRKERVRKERVRGAAYARFKPRFAIAYFVLAILLGASVGVATVIFVRDDTTKVTAWSPTEPTGTAAKKLRWIAHNVGLKYRFPDGGQLAQAIATRPGVPNNEANPPAQVPLVAIVEIPNYSTGEKEDSANEFYDPQSNAQFTLCGLGENCSFPASAGPPTQDRFLLLQREALELSLYAFRYVDGIETVTVFMPPRPDAEEPGTGTVMFLRRKDVSAQVEGPLSRTLSPRTPTIGEVSRAETTRLGDLTGSRLFRYGYREAQDGAAILILNPLANAVP
jgi:hypothetical protein